MLKQVTCSGAAYIALPRFLHRLWWRRSLGILMYHAVVEEPLAVPDWCFIPVQTFRRQMVYLQKYFQVLSLREAVKELVTDSIRRPTIALTFDDGYQNNHDVVLPILRDLGLPATVFLVTDLIGSDDTLWFCRLNQAFTLTRCRNLSWRGHEFPLCTREERGKTSALLQNFLKGLPHDEMLACAREIFLHLGSDPQEPIDRGSPYRMLDFQAIQTMAQSGLIDFGAHTSSHMILSRAPNQERLQAEIRNSIRETARLVGAPCRAFAYPNGGSQDYGVEHTRLLEEMGIDVAVTTIPEPNTPSTPVLELRRYGVGVDCSDAEFRCLVHHFDLRRVLRASCML